MHINAKNFDLKLMMNSMINLWNNISIILNFTFTNIKQVV